MSGSLSVAVAAVVTLTLSGCNSVKPPANPAPVNSPAQRDTAATLRAVGRYAGAALAIGEHEHPRLLVLNEGEITFVRCDDVGCRSFISTRIGNVESGNYALLAAPYALPVIVYSERLGAPLRILKCGDTACASSDEDEVAPFRYQAWQAVMDRGDVTIVGKRNDGVFERMTCTGADCSNAAVTPVPMPQTRDFSVTSAADGVWVLGILSDSSTVAAARCEPHTCVAVPGLGADADALDGWSLGIRADPTPRMHASAVVTQREISFEAGARTYLRLMECSSTGCRISELRPSSAVHTFYALLATRPNGLPLLAFNDSRDHALRVMTCEDVECANSATVAIGTGAVLSVTTSAPDHLVIVSAGDREGFVQLTRCSDASCRTSVSTSIDLRQQRQERAGQ